jgi:hypothetical protein
VKSNLETLCAAMDTMLRDTGETFFLRDARAESGRINREASNRVDMLVSDGRLPDQRDEILRTPSSDVDWTTPLDNDAVHRFSDHLVLNQPGGERASAYRTGGRFGWRGAYLGSSIPADPWGRRFAANVEFLGSPAGTSAPTGSINSVIVLSAGPNGVVETRFASTSLERGGDDLFCAIGAGSMP